MNGVGWLGAIIIGGIAGWIAERLMKSSMGIFANIILGIVGALVANAILHVFHVYVAAGWLGFLVTGIIGACVLIFIGRAIKR